MGASEQNGFSIKRDRRGKSKLIGTDVNNTGYGSRVFRRGDDLGCRQRGGARDRTTHLVLNICGGVPTLRENLPEICRLAALHLRSNIIHFPTNCLSPESLEKRVKEILIAIPSNIKLTVKMSLDGIGEAHDKVRGIEGNFDKVIIQTTQGCRGGDGLNGETFGRQLLWRGGFA